MYFALLLISLIFTSVASPGHIAPVATLTFVISPAGGGDLFYVSNLRTVIRQDGAFTLVPKMVTCPQSHESAAHDALPGVPGYQHVVAVAVDSDMNVLTDSKAALPCPPHCDGKKRKATIAEYLAEL